MRFFISKVCTFWLLSMVLFGCFRRSDEVRILASDFLEAYFLTDYDRAALMCTDSLSLELLSSLGVIDSLPKGVKEELVNMASKVKINIVEITENKDKESMIVLYTLILPETMEEIQKSLIVKKEGEEWEIASL